jgi:hypothetical protein
MKNTMRVKIPPRKTPHLEKFPYGVLLKKPVVPRRANALRSGTASVCNFLMLELAKGFEPLTL